MDWVPKLGLVVYLIDLTGTAGIAAGKSNVKRISFYERLVYYIHKRKRTDDVQLYGSTRSSKTNRRRHQTHAPAARETPTHS